MNDIELGQTKKYDWFLLSEMSESQAEDFMIENWGEIPEQWNDPLFRDQVTGISGQAELDAHMNFGELAYSGDQRLGERAHDIWYLRNINDQGHPAEEKWLKNKKS